MPRNQLQCKQAAERMWIKLRGPVEHSPSKLNPNIFADPNYENISNVKFTVNGCRHKFAVFSFFLEQDLNCLHAKFQIYGTSRSSFFA